MSQKKKINGVILEPNAEAPIREKWLNENKAAMNQIVQGITDVANGRVSRKGSFVKYKEDEIK